MASAAGTHHFKGSDETTASPLALVTGNVGYAQNYAVTLDMPPSSGPILVRTSSNVTDWATVHPGTTISIRVESADTLNLAASAPFFRYRSMHPEAPADDETSFKIRVSAGAMS